MASAHAAREDEEPEDVESAADFTDGVESEFECGPEELEDISDDSGDEEAAAAPSASGEHTEHADVSWVRAHLLRGATWLTRHHKHWSARTAKTIAGAHGVDKLESAIRRGASPAAALLGINWDSTNTHRIKHALAAELRGARAAPRAGASAASFVQASKLYDATALFRLVQGYNKQLCIPFVERIAAEEAGAAPEVSAVAWELVHGCPIRAALRIGRGSAFSSASAAAANAVAATVLRRLAQDADNDNE